MSSSVKKTYYRVNFILSIVEEKSSFSIPEGEYYALGVAPIDHESLLNVYTDKKVAYQKLIDSLEVDISESKRHTEYLQDILIKIEVQAKK